MCSDAVIAKQYALGQQLGIQGTPMIVFSDGTSLGGHNVAEQAGRGDRGACGGAHEEHERQIPRTVIGPVSDRRRACTSAHSRRRRCRVASRLR